MFAELRPVEFGPDASCQVLHLRSAGFRPLWHQHAVFELNYIVRGAGQRRVGAAVGRFGPGDLILVPPALPHNWSSDDDPAAAAEPTPAEAVVVLFRPDILGKATAPEWRAVGDLLASAGAALKFEAVPRDVVEALLRMPQLSGARRLGELLAVLDALSRTPSSPLAVAGLTRRAAARDLECVRRALDLVSEGEGALPRQQFVADALGMSQSRFSRAFKRGTGRTFSDHIEALRLERACALLQDGRLRVGEVCYAAGFSNLSNFNRRFRAAVGVTPRAYRQTFEADLRG
jgi:AraC-like DNA-binding protein